MKKKSFFILIFFFFSVNSFAQGSATDSILRYWLQPQIVNSNKPIANTLYFWVSTAELDSCVEQKRLLRTAVSDRHFEMQYIDELQYLNQKGNTTIVNHLLGAQRQFIREAWPCYWSAMHSLYSDSLQNQLVQVNLMDSALIVSFFPDEKKSKMWRVHDLKGNEIPIELALGRRRHFAVVYMEGDDKTVFVGPRRSVYRGHYRTFILCNENMIKSWFHNVPGLQAKVVNDLNYLVLLNAWFEKPENCAQHGSKGKVSYAAWTLAPASMRISDLFFATQRWSSYLSDPANQTSTMNIIEQLRDDLRKQKYSYERFPGKNPAYIPPRK